MKSVCSLLIFTLLSICTNVFAQSTLQLKSPDTHLSFQLTLKDNAPYYQVLLNGSAIIGEGALGIQVDGKDLKSVSSLALIKTTKVKLNYPSRGVHSEAKDNSQLYLINLNDQKGNTLLSLNVKVANDGVAFRYLKKQSKPSTINKDMTTFHIMQGSTIWSQGDIYAYEGNYKQQLIDQVEKGQKVGPPLTVQLPGRLGYLAITEGGLIDFAGMSLEYVADGIFKTVLAGATEKNGNINSPWRIIEYGKDLNELVNNDMISNVSEPYDKNIFEKGIATSWLKPGKSVWSWLADNGPITLDNMKKFSDMASELGIAYNLVDEGWGKWKDGNKTKWDILKELVDYSTPKNVGIWVWKAYPDRNDIAGLKDSTARIDFFKRCKEAGVVGIKIDFFDSESQEVIRFYEAALRDAAKMHLMLDFHGADKPTGLSRTYPNEMSREGIRGLENGSDWPVHNTTLLFTRFLAGHGDYTPLSFRDIVKGTTLTHQVATVASFTSEFMCLAVNPEELIKSNIRPMIAAIPETWDETIVLPQSKIGELAVYARRKGTRWFLSVLNGEKAQEIKVDLSFLKKGEYTLQALEDDHNDPSKAVLRTEATSNKQPLDIKLLNGGGFIGEFTRR